MFRSTINYRPDDLDAVESEMKFAIADGADPVVLELDHLETLDVPALRGLILLLRRARDAGADVALHTTNQQVRRILAVTALDRLFIIRSDSQAA
jgi:anti-anti-sigma factor